MGKPRIVGYVVDGKTRPVIYPQQRAQMWRILKTKRSAVLLGILQYVNVTQNWKTGWSTIGIHYAAKQLNIGHDTLTWGLKLLISWGILEGDPANVSAKGRRAMWRVRYLLDDPMKSEEEIVKWADWDEAHVRVIYKGETDVKNLRDGLEPCQGCGVYLPKELLTKDGLCRNCR